MIEWLTVTELRDQRRWWWNRICVPKPSMQNKINRKKMRATWVWYSTHIVHKKWSIQIVRNTEVYDFQQINKWNETAQIESSGRRKATNTERLIQYTTWMNKSSKRNPSPKHNIKFCSNSRFHRARHLHVEKSVRRELKKERAKQKKPNKNRTKPNGSAKHHLASFIERFSLFIVWTFLDPKKCFR